MPKGINIIEDTGKGLKVEEKWSGTDIKEQQDKSEDTEEKEGE